MNGSAGASVGRRGRPWRPLFFLPAVSLLATLHSADLVRGQDADAVRILRRHARVARESDGGYRVIEAFDIADSRVAGDTTPLPLAIIPAGVEDVRTLAGDVASTRLVYDPDRLVLMGGPPAPQYRFVFTYRLGPHTEVFELRALPPVDELVLDVDRGNVDAVPGPSLSAAGDAGTPARPSRRYAAHDLPPDGTVRLRLVRKRTEWRERLVVLIAVGAAAVLSGIMVWRRGTADTESDRDDKVAAGQGLAARRGRL